MSTSTNGETTYRNSHTYLALTGEDVLDLELSPLTPEKADEEIELCNSHLAIDGQPLSPGIVIIEKTAIDFLFGKVAQLKRRGLNYISGVKFSFAINDMAELKLLYQPVYMFRQPSDLMEPFYNLTEGNFFTFDESLGEFRPETDAARMMSRYQEIIRIKHRTDNTFENFIPGVDTNAVIFPFQTLYALMEDNNAHNIFIHNSIRKEDAGASYQIKHCVLLSTVSLGGNTFTGKYANRSHLCPPSCTLVQQGLAKIRPSGDN